MKKCFPRILVLALLAFQAGVPAYAMVPLNDFSDVPKGSGYYDAVSYLRTEGIVEGYPDGSYKPYQTINRAEFTKIVVGASGYNPAQDPSGYDIFSTSGLSFSDIQNGAWYNPYLRKAVESGIIGGYPDGTFKPAQEINFVEAAKIIVIADGGDFAGAGYAPDDWFHKYVNVLETNHAIPTTINTFDQKITRGEMAEIMYRMKTGQTGKPSMTYDELAALKGYVNGSLSYPGEGIPASLMVCADDVSMAMTYCTYNRVSGSQYEYGIGYTLPLKPGTYNVYAVESTLTGLYSEFVTCGMDASTCSSHASIPVTVVAGQTVKGVDPMDWYHQ